MSNPQPFTTTNTCKRCFNFNSIWRLEVMRQEIGGSRLLPPSCPFSSLYLCLVLGSSWQAQCLVPASGCLGWAPSALSGDGRSGGGGWLGGPMQLGLCFSALVVLAGVLCGSFCSTSAPAGSFQSLCCYGGSGMSHLFSVRPWLMSCGLW